MKLDKYLKHIQEQREDFEDKYKMYRRHGVIALLSIPPGSVYTYIFSSLKNRCTKRCKKFQVQPECWYKCYLDSANQVVRVINSDIGKITRIDDKTKRNQLRKKLTFQVERWERKIDKLKEKLRRIT
ncbi:MAG: hypothetical protein PVG65_01490 [Candidatus Thorarchaeota archaeon]|jgi:hypothetical protein